MKDGGCEGPEALRDNGREDWGSQGPGTVRDGGFGAGVGVAVGAGTRDCEDGSYEGHKALRGWEGVCEGLGL